MCNPWFLHWYFLMNTVLIIGAARSGIAVAKLLTHKGYKVVLSDNNEIKEKKELESMGIIVVDGGHPESLWTTKYDFVVKNPGIPYKVAIIQKVIAEGYTIYTEIEVASWYAQNHRYTAITGTNGKTTITTLLGEIFALHSGCVAGNIGIPLSEVTMKHEHDKIDIALELSNFQLLGTKKFNPHVSYISNLTPDHLDYMNSVEEYYASKCLIYQNQTKEDYFILNIDDPTVVEYTNNCPANVVTISICKPADIWMDEYYGYYKDVKLFACKNVKIVGKHNLMNVLATAGMAYLMGYTPIEIESVIERFSGVKHRLQFVATKHGITYYNDSKATNPNATKIAIEAFSKEIILIAGGYDKHISFSELKEVASNVKYCIGFGACKDQVIEPFNNTKQVATLEEALQAAIDYASNGDIILFAPACASFDQYNNYEERGDHFIQLVEKIG